MFITVIQPQLFRAGVGGGSISSLFKRDLRRRDVTFYRAFSGLTVLSRVIECDNITMNTVNYIVKINFDSLPLADKLKIKELGGPLPDIKMSQTCERKAEKRAFTRRFSKGIYTKMWV